MQRADVAAEVDLDVVGVHQAVAVDVDLKRGIRASLVDARFGVRRPRGAVECSRVHEMDRSGELRRHAREVEGVAAGVEVDDGVAGSGLRFGGAGEVEIVDGGAGDDGVGPKSARHRRGSAGVADGDVVVADAAVDGLGVDDGDVVGLGGEVDGVVAGGHVDDGGERLLGDGQGIVGRGAVDLVDVVQVVERVRPGGEIDRVVSLAEIDGEAGDVVEQGQGVVRGGTREVAAADAFDAGQGDRVGAVGHVDMVVASAEVDCDSGDVVL